jgi:aspartate dehydrogenase
MRLAVVGFGSIGRQLVAMQPPDGPVRVAQVVLSPRADGAAHAAARAAAPDARVGTALDLSPDVRPDLVVECAGHAAVESHVAPALAAGVPCVLASVGALHDAALLERLDAAARAGGTSLRLVAGAVGGLDALGAAALGPLDRVRYVGRKPPRSWPAPADGSDPDAARTVFEGNAREAARAFPKNANVAAAVALAGLGFEATEVTLVADPAVERNVHRVEAWGAFGHLAVWIENDPLPANPKTSALALYSLARAVRDAARAVRF